MDGNQKRRPHPSKEEKRTLLSFTTIRPYYICGDEPAQLNFEYVYYASPIQSVIDNQDAETKENEAINPPSDMLKNCEVYRALNDDDATLYNTLWQRLKSD